MTINIPKFSDDPFVTDHPGSFDVDITDKLGKDVTVRGVNPYTFGGPNAFFNRFGGGPTVPGDAVGAAGPKGDIAAQLGDLPKTQADRDMFAFGDKGMPTVPFQASEPVSLAMQDAEDNIKMKLQKGMITDDEYDTQLTELRNRPPVVPGAASPTMAPGGLPDIKTGGFTTPSEINLPGNLPTLQLPQAKVTYPRLLEYVKELFTPLKTETETYDRGFTVPNELSLGGTTVQAPWQATDVSVPPGQRTSFAPGQEDRSLVPIMDMLLEEAGLLHKRMGDETEALIDALPAWARPGSLRGPLFGEDASSEGTEEVVNTSNYTEGSIYRTPEEIQAIQGARYTAMMFFGQVLGSDALYKPGKGVEMPRTISSYEAAELPYKPGSAKLKAYFKETFGVEGFDTWEDMLSYLKYAPDPSKPWLWVRQDKAQVAAGGGLYNYGGYYGKSYGYGGGGGGSYPRSSGGSSSYTYSPMVMWRIGL